MKSVGRKATVGGIVVLGVGLAFLLRGIGLQIGTQGEGTAENSAQNVTLEQQADIMADAAGDSSLIPVKPKLTESVPLPDTSQQLTIIVEETHFLWGTNTTPPQIVKELSLDEILKMASHTSGDQSGVRIRLFHLASALPSAENELLEGLKRAGLTETDIEFEQRVLELP